MGEWASDRQVLQITGSDAQKFLQDLITNDILRMSDGLVYAALLTPQGKYLFDFFISKLDDGFLLDVKADQADRLAQRLTLYKLRADVQITTSDLHVNRSLTNGSFADPRHPAMGYRTYAETQAGQGTVDWDALRVEHCIPETGIELIADQTFILEADFERLNGVDFRKGCYVGQEVTARMKHKTELRKGFVTVEINGTAAIGTDIMSGDKVAGQLFTQSGNRGIAYLRFGRAGTDMNAGEAQIIYRAPT